MPAPRKYSRHFRIVLLALVGMLALLCSATAETEAATLAQGEASSNEGSGIHSQLGVKGPLERGAPTAALATPLRHAMVAPPQAQGRKKVIYLTFDDGPSPTWTPQVLRLLARYHARATFFVVGQDARAHPELMKAIVAGRHAVGNHTYDHPWLGRMSRDQVIGELKRTQKALGSMAPSCMRPPFGSTNRFTRSYAEQVGLKLVMWDVDPRDWSRPGAARIASFILANATPGATVLLHDGGKNRSQTVAALDTVLRELNHRGYRFETIPACR